MISARDIDPVVGHRLASLADGEGCFFICGRPLAEHKTSREVHA